MRVRSLLLFFFVFLTQVTNGQGKGISTGKTTSDDSARRKRLHEQLNTGSRVALVIGNANYDQGKLKNPVHDAEAIRDVLTSSGFKVLYRPDIRSADIDSMLHVFGNSIAGNNGVHLFYYSGHGLQYNGENYYLPVDARITDTADFHRLRSKLQYVLETMNRASRSLNIVILDACRTAPFPALQRLLKEGLTDSDHYPVNTTVFYATRPNQTAADGEGKHSPFTRSFLEHVQNDSVDFYEIARRVSRDVVMSTSLDQQPVLMGMAYDEFYFKQKPFRKPSLFLVGIGISKYDSTRRLVFGAKSALDFVSFMKQFASDDTTYQAIQSFALPDAEATRENINRLVAEVKAKVREGDVVLFYYNGWIIRGAGGRSFVLPVDGNIADIETTGLACERIFSLLTELPCKSVLFLDQVQGDKPGAVGVAQGSTSKKDGTFDLIGELNSPANNVVVISSAKVGEYSFESEDHRTTVFLYSLLNSISGSLRKKGSADIESIISAMETTLPALTKNTCRAKIFLPKGWLNFPLFRTGN